MTLWQKLKQFVRPTTVTTVSGTDTEFTAEVARITEILPHPNADRLEIARFELKTSGPSAYDVVIQKGAYKPGDLAAYFSVDCLLPTSHPEFKFLTERLDGAGKSVYRLRAARLRGVFSQGLLVNPADLAFGDSCAARFGVSYHRAPEPAAGPTNATKKPRVQPMPIYGVESLKKVPRLFTDGELVRVTEKIHGTNVRFGWVRRKFMGIPLGWKFVVGSHRVIKEGKGSHFYREDVWTEAATKYGLAEKTHPFRGSAFYGELYGYTCSGERIQDLTYERTPAEGPGLVVFDVLVGGRWLTPEERDRVLETTGLRAVPNMYEGYYHEGVLGMAEGRSRLNPKQIREGVVVETMDGPRKKAKYVGQGYLLRKES